MTEIQNIIRKKYSIEEQLLNRRKKKEQLEAELPRRMREVREAKSALLEYESGGLRSFRDKISGKYGEKLEMLSRAVRQAEEGLAAAKREIDMEREAIARLEDAEKILPTRESLFAQYPGMEYLLRQDALFAARRMLPALEENGKLLTEARDWAGNRQVGSMVQDIQYNKSLALQKAGVLAREALALLEQIRECGFDLEIHAYFRNPDGYIADTARQFGQQDQINFAIRAIRATREQIHELILQLAEE